MSIPCTENDVFDYSVGPVDNDFGPSDSQKIPGQLQFDGPRQRRVRLSITQYHSIMHQENLT